MSGPRRSAFARWVPTRDEFPRGAREWGVDILAGVTVGVVALPLAMGFGIATGVGATPGIATAIVAGFVAALFGGSHLQVSGPTGAMTVVLVPAVAEHGIGAVPILAILAGMIVALAGLLRLGRAVNLIPWPVIEGFTFGIATIIFLQQVPLLVNVPRPDDHNTLLATIDVLGRTRWDETGPALCVAAGVIAAMIAVRRLKPTLPASLIAILLATGAAWAFDLEIATIGSLSLSSLFAVPDLPGMDAAGGLMRSALVVAVLAALESLLSARVADGMSDVERTDPDRELFGQGLANVASGLVGGMPATGAIARTAVNVRAGARTRAAAATHSVVLLVVLFGASSVLAQVPLAALAAVLMVTAVHMVDMPTIRALLGAGRASAVVFCVTAASTILFDLARAVEVGIVVAAILVLRASAASSGLHAEHVSGQHDHADDDELSTLLHDHVVVYRLQGMLFFGAAQRFVEELVALDESRVVVLRLEHLQVLDVTGARALAETVDHYEHRGVWILICGADARHERVLRAVGIPGSRIPAQHVFQELGPALTAARGLAVRGGRSEA